MKDADSDATKFRFVVRSMTNADVTVLTPSDLIEQVYLGAISADAYALDITAFEENDDPCN